MNETHPSSTESGENVYTVSQLNRGVRKLLEESYRDIQVEGEISGLQTARSGHSYFKLKDEFAEIDCALFRSNASRIRQKPSEGLKVVLTGRVTLYVDRGRYQFIVENLKLGGQGDMWKKFQLLKKKLGDDGLFTGPKQDIPSFPDQVGIVSSPGGAAVHDIIRAFARRFPFTNLLLYPVAVQGDGAADQIAGAIKLANARNEVDVLIVGRGGGSLEDLWAFNEEVVARAIHESQIPIVTGIGHQTDISISDWVADRSAATPTAAAELVSTPSREELLRNFSDREIHLRAAVNRKLNDLAQRTDLAQRGLVHPKQRVENLQDKFQLLLERLHRRIGNTIRDQSAIIHSQRQQLLGQSPVATLERHWQKLQARREVLILYANELLKHRIAAVHSYGTRLEGVNPAATLKRGYAVIRRADDNALVRNSQTITVGDKVKAQLHQGTLHCDVESVDP